MTFLVSERIPHLTDVSFVGTGFAVPRLRDVGEIKI